MAILSITSISAVKTIYKQFKVVYASFSSFNTPLIDKNLIKAMWSVVMIIGFVELMHLINYLWQKS